MSDYLYVTGRIVSGNPFEKQPDRKDERTGIVKEGGWFVGIAVPKGDPEAESTRAAVMAVAKDAWPNGEWQYPNFSTKIKDGDLPPQNSKEGYPGHWVFGFAQSWPFTVYERGAAAQIVDPKGVKKGDYVRVPFQAKGSTAKVHKNQTPGLFLNAALIEFVGYGPAIMSGPDPKTVMANLPPISMPAGASATPVANSTPIQPPTPQQPPAPQQAYQPPAPAPVPTPQQPPAPAPVPPVITPAPDFLNPPVLTAKAGGASYQQFIDQGWTKELLIQHGYLQA